MNTLDQADFDAIWKPDMIFLNKGRTFTQTSINCILQYANTISLYPCFFAKNNLKRNYLSWSKSILMRSILFIFVCLIYLSQKYDLEGLKNTLFRSRPGHCECGSQVWTIFSVSFTFAILHVCTYDWVESFHKRAVRNVVCFRKRKKELTQNYIFSVLCIELGNTKSTKLEQEFLYFVYFGASS